MTNLRGSRYGETSVLLPRLHLSTSSEDCLLRSQESNFRLISGNAILVKWTYQKTKRMCNMAIQDLLPNIPFTLTEQTEPSLVVKHVSALLSCSVRGGTAWCGGSSYSIFQFTTVDVRLCL